MRGIVWLGATLLTSLLVFGVAATQAPSFIMGRAMSVLETRYEIGINRMGHSQPITAASREIVRPSPDLAYSICLYDASEGPVEIKMPRTKNYLSLALYDLETNNFYRTNDKEMGGKAFSLLILGPDTTPPVRTDKTLIHSPQARGLALVRRVVGSKEAWEVIAREREQMVCQPYS